MRWNLYLRQVRDWLLGEATATPLLGRGPLASGLAVDRPAACAAPLIMALPRASGEADVRARRRAAALSVFNPAQPVENRRHLLGREAEMRQLCHAVLDVGMHALIHGSRGAGKTSLARAFGDYADEQGHLVIYLSCGGDSSFAGLFRPYVEELGEALPPQIGVPLAEAAARAGEAMGPRALCGLLARAGDHRVVLVVDEFDRVEDPATRADVAALLKLLSDARLPVRLLLVGIARDVTGLIDAHASLRRHLVSIPLRRFDGPCEADLFDRGERATGIVFPPEHRARIAALAAGSPYHLRLFCYATALAAIEGDADGIDSTSLEAGLRSAYDLWAGGNPSVAMLFQRLAAQGDGMRERLSAFAVAALAHDPFGADRSTPAEPALVDLDIFASLAPALAYGEQDRGYAFDDSLAPQFLLVACHLAGSADALPEPRQVASRPKV